MLATIREHAGVLLRDSRRYRLALSGDERADNGDPLWLHLCNRNEQLEPNPSGPGVRCPWRWTSDLHACNVRPEYGRALAGCAFAEWPVSFADSSYGQRGPSVTFIIAHEGQQRVDHVVWTVRSILAQSNVDVECIVVDQSDEPVVEEFLPAAARYLHRPRPDGLTGWRKSWAFNQGAREARGGILVFHDGDIVCPSGYAAAITQQMEEYGAASIQRFLFNLSKADTDSLFKTGTWAAEFTPERVRQNWEGGTIAVQRDQFFELGGYDEAFVGWGGEDNEFFNRCSAIGHLTYGFVPFVHLWHPPQSDKHTPDNRNITHALDTRLAIPVKARATELNLRAFGATSQPDPLHGYRDADFSRIADSGSTGPESQA